MASRSTCVLTMVLTVGWACLARGAYYDNFDDGSCAEDPNAWDIDDPHWVIQQLIGDTFYAAVDSGWLHLFVDSSGLSYGVLGAHTDDGDDDPNTSASVWDDTTSHYILARVANVAGQTDPNDDIGVVVLTMHGDLPYWWTFSAAYQFKDDRPWDGADLIVQTNNGIFLQWLVNTKVRGADPSQYDPNDPNWLDPNNLWNTPGYMDEHNGFWMVLQFESDGLANDPNGKWLKCACWNGEKFDWDGNWTVSKDLGMIDAGLAWWPEWYWSGGVCGLGSYGDLAEGLPSDVAFDNIEARTGVFTNVSRMLSLTVKTVEKGTVTIDPDLLDDPNNASSDPNEPTDPNEPRRYTDGTEIVLVGTPVKSKAFKTWKIYDPNHPGDGNYIVQDTNAVLYLTMDGDHEVEAIFKCGSGQVLPVVGMVLLSLTLCAVVRRAERVGG